MGSVARLDPYRVQSKHLILSTGTPPRVARQQTLPPHSLARMQHICGRLHATFAYTPVT
jgi:hypothetical protein